MMQCNNIIVSHARLSMGIIQHAHMYIYILPLHTLYAYKLDTMVAWYKIIVTSLPDAIFDSIS